MEGRILFLNIFYDFINDGQIPEPQEVHFD